MQLKTGEHFGSARLSRSMARHRRCSVYVLPNGPLSFPTSLIGPPHREPKQGWHINITAEWVASILLSRFEVMTEPSRMDFTWRDVCQHSLRLVYWIKHQKGINGVFFLYFCLMQRLRVGCDLCQSGPAHDFSSLVLFPMPFKTSGPNFYPPLQTLRRKKKERGKIILEHWLIRSRKNDQSCTLTFLLLPFPNPSPLPWQCPVDEGEYSILPWVLLEVAWL